MLFGEGLFTVAIRGGQEYKFISPCIALYLGQFKRNYFSLESQKVRPQSHFRVTSMPELIKNRQFELKRKITMIFLNFVGAKTYDIILYFCIVKLSFYRYGFRVLGSYLCYCARKFNQQSNSLELSGILYLTVKVLSYDIFYEIFIRLCHFINLCLFRICRTCHLVS